MKKQFKYFVAIIIAITTISSCSYNSFQRQTSESPFDQKMQTIVFAIVISFDRVLLAGDPSIQKPAIELLLDLGSGNTTSIIQKEGNYLFAIGQRVQIIKSNGRSRVMPVK